MDRVCKKVLKQMHGDGPPERFAFWLFDDALHPEADACGLPVEEFANAINQLIAEGGRNMYSPPTATGPA